MNHPQEMNLSALSRSIYSVHCEHENINSQNIYINLHCGISLLHPSTTICNTLHKEMGFLLEHFKVSFKVPVFKKYNQVPGSLGPELGFVKKGLEPRANQGSTGRQLLVQIQVTWNHNKTGSGFQSWNLFKKKPNLSHMFDL